MTDSNPATAVTLRQRLWSAYTWLPTWSIIAFAVLLLLGVAAWGLFWPVIRERQAIERLNNYPDGLVIGSPRLYGYQPGLLGALRQMPCVGEILVKLSGDEVWRYREAIVRFGEKTPIAALAELRHIRRIDEVSLKGVQWTDREIGTVIASFKVRRLVLIGTGVTDAGWKALEGRSFAEIEVGSQSIGPEFFRVVRTMPGLKSLTLHGCPITDADLKLLGAHPTLLDLSLRESQVTSACIEALELIPNLRLVDVGETVIDDRFLSELGRLKNVKTLSIEGTKVTDAGLAAIPAAVRLKSLSLISTDVSEVGLLSLKQVPPFLYLDGTRLRLTAPVLQWFQAHRFNAISLDDSMLDPESEAAEQLASHVGNLDIWPTPKPTGE